MSRQNHGDIGAALLEAITGQTRGAQAPKESPKPLPMQARVLKDMLPAVQRPCPFKPGDLVRQTKGCDIYRFPDSESLAIVMEVGPQPRDPNRPEHRADMRILMLCNLVETGEKAWGMVGVESWRFEKYDGPIEGLTEPGDGSGA